MRVDSAVDPTRSENITVTWRRSAASWGFGLAPTVTWVQAWKAKCGNWCRKIVAARFGEFEKRRSHNGTDRVTANILSPGVAAAIPIKSRHGFDRTDIKRLAEHISWTTPPTASVTPIAPQHCRLPPLPNSQQASD